MPEPAQTEDSPRSRRFVWPFVAVLVAGAAAASLSADLGPLGREPVTLVALVATAVFLFSVRIDVFERAKFTPAVPNVALACMFGPAGPILGELVVYGPRLLRAPPVRATFDLGGLALAGVAAALAYAALPTGAPGLVVASATVAGLAYYVVNIVSLSLVLALYEGSSPVAVFRERFAWMWWHYALHGTIAGLFVVAEQRLGALALLFAGLPLVSLFVAERQYLSRARSSVRELRESHDELEAANARLQTLLDANTELLERTRRNSLGTITTLARAIEAKDPYTGSHTERVAGLACLLAAELGFGGDDLPAVEVGGVIHDIGKIGIPDSILLKPGKLDDAEFAEMKRHPLISSHILDGLDLPRIVLDMARHHHERLDGRGYPDGLAGEDIPLAARVLTVADSLDAMTSDRPYRDARPLAAAIEELDRNAGSQFCPTVLAALHALLARDPSLGGLYDEPAPVADDLPPLTVDAMPDPLGLVD